MKFMKLVPCSKSCAIQALLSVLAETWQSLHCLVSLARTEYGTGRTRGRNAVAGDRAIHAKHIYVVAQNLEVVTGVVLCEQAFVVQHGLARVGGHLRVAAETGGRPRSMAGVAGHAAIGVGE